MTEYTGYRDAGARLTEPAAVDTSTPVSPEILLAVHQFDKAHAIMLVEERLIPPDDGAAILRKLLSMDDGDVVQLRNGAGGGIHSGEHYLIHELGEQVGGRIHLGRSSADLTAVARRIVSKHRLLSLVTELNRLRTGVIRAARANLTTVMPSYTHGQQAQPVTWAHWLSMYLAAFARDAERVLQYMGRIDASPAGAAVGTGTDFPLNRDRVRELLGFGRISENTLDAVNGREAETEELTVLMLHTATLSRLAEELMLWSSQEFGFLRLPDRYCSTSSILAHKRNPVTPQRMRGAAARAIGGVAAAMYADKAESGGAVFDRGVVSETTGVLHAELATLLPQVAGILEDSTLDRDRMYAVAGEYWTHAPEIAGMLVRDANLPWRSAHQIAARLVRFAEEQGIAARDVTPELVASIASAYAKQPITVTAASLQAATDPRLIVERRTLPGGPAPAAVEQFLSTATRQIDHDAGAVSGLQAQDDAARTLLRRTLTELAA